MGGGRAAPDGGWGGAEICSVFPYILTACRRIFFICCPVFRTLLPLNIAMRVPNLNNIANIL